MWSSFVAILLKEFKHIFRDRGTLVLFFMLPVIQLALFGFLDQNVRNLPTVVVDQDQTRYSRELIDGCARRRRSRSPTSRTAREEARAMIAQGTARVGVVIPPDFHDKRARERQRAVPGPDRRLRLERQRAGARRDQRPRRAAQPRRGRGARRPSRCSRPSRSSCSTRKAAPRTTSSPASSRSCCRSPRWCSPSIAIVREREQGTMEQLLVTPINPLGLVLGKLAPYLVIGIVEMALILLHHAVGLRRADPAAACCSCSRRRVIYLFALLALGLTSRCARRRRWQAQQMAQMLLLPSIFLSRLHLPGRGPAEGPLLDRPRAARHAHDRRHARRGAALRRSARPAAEPPRAGAISVVLVTDRRFAACAS